MPDCLMTIPGMGGLFAVPATDVMMVFNPESSSDVFDRTSFFNQLFTCVHGLRRPPKI